MYARGSVQEELHARYVHVSEREKIQEQNLLCGDLDSHSAIAHASIQFAI